MSGPPNGNFRMLLLPILLAFRTAEADAGNAVSARLGGKGELTLGSLGRRYPVVVVDDGSFDPAAVAAVGGRHGARIEHRLDNGGPGPARNHGWRRVDTDLVAFLDSDCAAERTCDEAEPVSLAPCCTSVIFDETCWVPCAACCTLREISCVAAPCSSTAAAMVEEISDSFSMVPLISLIAPTDSCVSAWMPLIC